MSQLFAYIGRPGSVRTSRHLDSSACATQCLGHPGHPRTCQDTYQESGIVVTIQAVWNCPPNPDYCDPAGHAQCTILLYKPLHSTADYTCILRCCETIGGAYMNNIIVFQRKEEWKEEGKEGEQ